MSPKASVKGLAARVDRVRSAGRPDWMTDEVMDRIFRALGSDSLRDFVGSHPGCREALEPSIAAVEEWEATEPRWWPEGPPGLKRWRYGIRERGEDGSDGV